MDKRFKHRHEKAMDALEALESRLRDLAELDEDMTDAVWQTYACDAVGCVEGIRQILLRAHETRREHIERHKQPPPPPPAKE